MALDTYMPGYFVRPTKLSAHIKTVHEERKIFVRVPIIIF